MFYCVVTCSLQSPLLSAVKEWKLVCSSVVQQPPQVTHLARVKNGGKQETQQLQEIQRQDICAQSASKQNREWVLNHHGWDAGIEKKCSETRTTQRHFFFAKQSRTLSWILAKPWFSAHDIQRSSKRLYIFTWDPKTVSHSRYNQPTNSVFKKILRWRNNPPALSREKRAVLLRPLLLLQVSLPLPQHKYSSSQGSTSHSQPQRKIWSPVNKP